MGREVFFFFRIELLLNISVKFGLIKERGKEVKKSFWIVFVISNFLY